MCYSGQIVFHQVTNHPVHILNVNETFSPSAFIPFCAFGEDMKAMGKRVDGFDDHVKEELGPNDDHLENCSPDQCSQQCVSQQGYIIMISVIMTE